MEKLTIEQFGATVKAKHPQYAKFSDAEVANLTLRKYPEYKSRIAQPVETTQDQGYLASTASKLGDVVKDTYSNAKEMTDKGAQNFKDINSRVSSGEQTPLSGTVESVSNIGRTVLGATEKSLAGAGAALNALVPDWLTKVVNEGSKALGDIGTNIRTNNPDLATKIDATVNEIDNSPTMKFLITKTKENPDLLPVLGEAINVVLAGKGIEASKNFSKAASETIGEVKGTVSSVVDSAKTTAQTVVKNAKDLPKIFKNEPLPVEQSAILDATPSYSKKLIGDQPITSKDGSVKPRITESQGLLKQRKVNPTQSEIEAGTELAKVEGYNPSATSLDKYNLVQNDIIKKSKSLESSLKSEKVVRPKKEISKLIKDAVNTASQDSLLLQKTDPLVINYLRVAERAIAKMDGTLDGELSVRKALDRAYEDAGGKYGNNKGLDQIHRAARNAINDDLEAKATNTEVKASLKQQSNLYKAMDVLQDKAQVEGGTKWEQFKKKYPTATKAVIKTGNAVGLGGVISTVNGN